MCWLSINPGSLNLLEPFEPAQACIGIALPLPLPSAKRRPLMFVVCFSEYTAIVSVIDWFLYYKRDVLVEVVSSYYTETNYFLLMCTLLTNAGMVVTQKLHWQHKVLYYLHLTLAFWIIVHLRGESNSGAQNRGCVTRHCGGQHTTPISLPPALSPRFLLISTPNLQYIIRNESNFNGTVTVFLRDPFYSKRHIALSQTR